MRPHRRQPTRLPGPWDSPGKNTGMGFHFLLQCMKVKSKSEFTQSCPTLSDPMDCSLPGSTVPGIFQARVLEWVVTAFSTICLWVCVNVHDWVYTWVRCVFPCMCMCVHGYRYTWVQECICLCMCVPVCACMHMSLCEEMAAGMRRWLH